MTFSENERKNRSRCRTENRWIIVNAIWCYCVILLFIDVFTRCSSDRTARGRERERRRQKNDLDDHIIRISNEENLFDRECSTCVDFVIHSSVTRRWCKSETACLVMCFFCCFTMIQQLSSWHVIIGTPIGVQKKKRERERKRWTEISRSSEEGSWGVLMLFFLFFFLLVLLLPLILLLLLLLLLRLLLQRSSVRSFVRLQWRKSSI